MLLSAGLLLTLYIGWGVAANTVVDYSSHETISSYSDSGIHVVLVFHTTDAREILLNDLVEPLAAKNTQLIFVLVDREKFRDVSRTYFLPRDLPDYYIMVVPPGKDGIHVPPSNIPYTVPSLSHLFASMLNEPQQQQPSVLFIDAHYVSQTLDAMPKNVIAAFCWDAGSSHCKDYGTMLEAALNPAQRLYIEPMVVTVHDLKDLPQGVIVPSVSIYNITSRQWTMCGVSVAQCITDHDSHSKQALLSSVPPHPWLAKQLNEDDYFGLMARKEPPARLPPSLFLTDKTFVSHVTQYETTAVVFCLKWSVRCKHLFHHVMSAAEELDQANNSIVSLKVVSCGDFPDVCAFNGITSYPTILVFHGSTEHSHQYRGMLDVDHLLEAAGLCTPARHSLAELRPDTLPTLFSSHPGSALVLFCMTQERAEELLGTLPQSSMYPGLTWAWVDSNYYPLLQKSVPTISDGAMLILDFANGKIYCNHPGSQLKTLSIFVEDFIAGRLIPDGMFVDKKWHPLQPPISFPSTVYETKAPKISEIQPSAGKRRE